MLPPTPGSWDTRPGRLRLLQGAFGTLADVRVAEREGRVVGISKLYSFELWIGGRPMPVFGIGGVGVAPDARRTGIARAMIDALHAESKTRGGVLTLLFAFREQFYARLGYVATAPSVTVRLAGGSIERAFFIDPVGRGPEFATVAIGGGELAQVKQLYADACTRTSGRIARTEARWIHLCADEKLQFLGVTSGAGELGGYLMFSYRQGPSGAPTTLIVSDLVARDAPAERALFAALARQMTRSTNSSSRCRGPIRSRWRSTTLTAPA